MTGDTPAEPTLKCVLAWSPRRNLCSLVADRLANLVPEPDVRPLGDEAQLAYTALTADHLRDALRAVIDPDEALLVIDFETWSSHGRAVDATWLLAHGH